VGVVVVVLLLLQLENAKADTSAIK
jgi:hypothetical protein